MIRCIISCRSSTEIEVYCVTDSYLLYHLRFLPKFQLTSQRSSNLRQDRQTLLNEHSYFKNIHTDKDRGTRQSGVCECESISLSFT